MPVYALQRHHIRAPPPYSFWQAQTEDMNLEDMNLTTVGLLGRGVDSPDRARGPLRASLDPWALFLYIMKQKILLFIPSFPVVYSLVDSGLDRYTPLGPTPHTLIFS